MPGECALPVEAASLCCLGLHAKEGQGNVFTRGCSQFINHSCITGPAEDLRCGFHDSFHERLRVVARSLVCMVSTSAAAHGGCSAWKPPPTSVPDSEAVELDARRRLARRPAQPSPTAALRAERAGLSPPMPRGTLPGCSKGLEGPATPGAPRGRGSGKASASPASM